MSKGALNRAALVALVVALPVATVSGSAAASAPAMVRVGAAPRVPTGAHSLGTVSSSASLSGTVVLKPRDNAALVQFVNAVSNPSSPLFHQYLPAGAFASRFGPTKATIDAVRSQLTAGGLRVTGVSSDGLLVNFSGTAAQIEHAFQTGVERYRLSNGAVGQTTTSAASVPSAIAGSVAGIVGLNDLARARPAGIVHPQGSARGRLRSAETTTFTHPGGAPTPCPAATADAQQNGGLTDDQIARAYGAFGLYDNGDLGQGQHIALYELEPFLYSDVRTFDTCFFGAAQASAMLSRLNVIPVDGGQPTGPGSGEANLDVEDLSAMAPDATIDVYERPSPGANGLIYDPVDEYAAIIDADRDQIISTSWGLCEQAIQAGQPGLQQAENFLFEQAAAQGQSVFSAAGDNGSDDCNTFETPTVVSGQNPVSVDDPSSQPYVVSVGGTTIDDGHRAAGGAGLERRRDRRRRRRRHLRVVDDADLAAGRHRAGDRPARQRRLHERQHRASRSSAIRPNFCQSTVAGAGPLDAVPSRARCLCAGRRVHRSGHGLRRVGGRLGHDRRDLLLDADLGGDAGGDQRLADVHIAARHRATASASSTRCCMPWRRTRLITRLRSTTSRTATTTSTTSAAAWCSRPRSGYDLATGLGSPQLTAPGGGPGLAYYLCSFAAHGSPTGGDRPEPGLGQHRRRRASHDHRQPGSSPAGCPTWPGSQVGARAVGARPLHGRRARRRSPRRCRRRARRSPPDAPAPQDGAGPADVIVHSERWRVERARPELDLRVRRHQRGEAWSRASPA